MNSFVQDRSVQAPQREDNQKDDAKAESLLRLLPTAFQCKVSNRNNSSITLQFSPDPSFHAPTREARVFAAMTGMLTVDNQRQRIREFKGHLVHDVDFGGGLLGKLERGGDVSYRAQPVGTGDLGYHAKSHPYSGPRADL